MVFKKYASPFLLLDNYIKTNRLLEFVLNFIDKDNEERVYDIWLHKVHDKTYEDFKNEVMTQSKVQATTKEEMSVVVNKNMNLLEDFKPY